MRRDFRAALLIAIKGYSELVDCLELAKMPERPSRCPKLFFLVDDKNENMLLNT